jgi:serine phosphatase RsbU (regulator of sigma subunit)/pSer/pThr/pTyr-binding forkhead associated (FHA) protein
VPERGSDRLEIVDERDPRVPPLSLDLGARIVLGRGSDCDLVVDDASVSRQHAAISVDASGASVEDLGSRHGTRVNGRLIGVGRSAQLEEGDRVQLGPRVLRIRNAMSRVRAESTGEASDTVRTIVVGARGGAEHALRVLIEVVRGIPADDSAESAGRLVLAKLLAVTGLERAVLVRFDESRADAEILAESGTGARAVSRTLLSAASDPMRVAHLSQSHGGIQSAESILAVGVREALCARVVVEGDDGLYLYLDGTGSRASVDAGMAEVVGAAARICGLVIESVARRRLEALRLDVERARQVQRRLLAEDEGAIGEVAWSLHSLPGLLLAGDFAGIAPRPDGSVLAWVGDVSGKGAAAAMLMASAQAWMYAAATRAEPLAESVAALSAFLAARSEASEFATMFALLLAPDGGVTLCDAGHGIAFLVENGTATRIEPDGGLPVGVTVDADYGTSTLELARGARIVIATDGVHEQRAANGEMFGLERIVWTLSESPSAKDDVARIVASLRAHAGTTFEDDVTVLSIARL